MRSESAEHFVEHMQREAPSLWRRMTTNGLQQMMTVFHLLNADGHHTVCAFHLYTQQHVATATRYVQLKAREVGALAATVLFEAYLSDHKQGPDLAAHHATKLESLGLLIQLPVEGERLIAWRIQRDRHTGAAFIRDSEHVERTLDPPLFGRLLPDGPRIVRPH